MASTLRAGRLLADPEHRLPGPHCRRSRCGARSRRGCGGDAPMPASRPVTVSAAQGCYRRDVTGPRWSGDRAAVAGPVQRGGRPAARVRDDRRAPLPPARSRQVSWTASGRSVPATGSSGSTGRCRCAPEPCTSRPRCPNATRPSCSCSTRRSTSVPRRRRGRGAAWTSRCTPRRRSPSTTCAGATGSASSTTPARPVRSGRRPDARTSTASSMRFSTCSPSRPPSVRPLTAHRPPYRAARDDHAVQSR